MIILSTAALIPFKEEERKQEYIEGTKNYIRIANQHMDGEVRIIESTGNYIPSFFEELVLPENIVYTKTNNSNLRNKGVNEGISIRAGLIEFFKNGMIDPEECVIKVTGRYQFEEDNFIEEAVRLIESEKSHDVVAYLHPDKQLFTGCFATRAKHLLEFVDCVDYQTIEQRMINLESVCSYWASAQRMHIVNKLGIFGKCAFGNPFRW